MAIAGRRTRAIFDRYNITSERDLREVIQKIQEHRTVDGHLWSFCRWPSRHQGDQSLRSCDERAHLAHSQKGVLRRKCLN